MSAKINESLRSLSPCDYAALMVAFDNQMSYYVELKNGYYIGVNCGHLPGLLPEDTSDNGFSFGRIK